MAVMYGKCAKTVESEIFLKNLSRSKVLRHGDEI